MKAHQLLPVTTVLLMLMAGCGFEPFLGQMLSEEHKPAESSCPCKQPPCRVFFAANMNAGARDGNCDQINRFLWADDKPGKSMFFAGAIHPESPIQDAGIDQLLGNWQPNLIRMYDDAKCGDQTAGDGIWTVAFNLPDGLRIGYKYTWGLQGDNWGGTEEWPGNRRILEIVDVNGDGVAARLDNFADETTNKDLANRLLPSKGGKGSVTWDTDANKDGIADARERRYDSDNDCQLDTWWSPDAFVP